MKKEGGNEKQSAMWKACDLSEWQSNAPHSTTVIGHIQLPGPYNDSFSLGLQEEMSNQLTKRQEGMKVTVLERQRGRSCARSITSSAGI